MASERDQALQHVITDSGDETRRLTASSESEPPHPPADAKLVQALSKAETTVEIEQGKQDLIRLRLELGWFGRVFGTESHAAVIIALVVVLLGFGTAIGLWVAAAYSPRAEYWASEAHIALGTATTALAYVFGKASKDSPKT